jgi:hypothetical protein
MTRSTRRQTPDERAATDNTAIPPSSTPQTSSTRTTSTPHSPPRGNHGAQTPLPTKTSKTKNCNLEIFCPQLATLDNTVTHYSPSVYETHQAPQHTKHITITCPNHRTQTTHTNNRKRPRVAFNPTLSSETPGDITSPKTQQPTYIIEIPYASKRTQSSHPNPPHQQHRNRAPPPTTHPVNARPSKTATDTYSTQTHAHK